MRKNTLAAAAVIAGLVATQLGLRPAQALPIGPMPVSVATQNASKLEFAAMRRWAYRGGAGFRHGGWGGGAGFRHSGWGWGGGRRWGYWHRHHGYYGYPWWGIGVGLGYGGYYGYGGGYDGDYGYDGGYYGGYGYYGGCRRVVHWRHHVKVVRRVCY